ncbi:uncharacterized protein LOC134195901 [Corticium candelabrum]|uniref:uncharacterized protein LOC134195901 n=1 Tax=Corticium candelabrum TaxID=121492 RepID=UPI002E259839|nr:uncharacterized protein LOC134195901 [Corticium candelabrum]
MQSRGFQYCVFIVFGLTVVVALRRTRKYQHGNLVGNTESVETDRHLWVVRGNNGRVEQLATRSHLQRRLFDSQQVASHGARCLDGSSSGYYIRRGTLNTSWVIFLQGGGHCGSENDCNVQARGILGSSHHWPELKTGRSLLSLDSTLNKDFRNWNHVDIPYCSGDVYTGQRRKPNKWGLYFAGHLSLVAILSDLLNTTSLTQAKRVIISGASAGAVAAFEHADFISNLLPWADVKAVPIGGVYLPKDVQQFTYWKSSREQPERNAFLHDLYQSFTHVMCRNANRENAHRCGPANVAFLLPYIATPLFIAENQYDSDKLQLLGCPFSKGMDQMEYVQYYGERVRETLLNVSKSEKRVGVFSPSCLDHTASLNKVYKSPRIAGNSFGKLLHKWYFSSNTHRSTNLVERCDETLTVSTRLLPCNRAAQCKRLRS